MRKIQSFWCNYTFGNSRAGFSSIIFNFPNLEKPAEMLIFLCSAQRKNMEFQLTGRSDRYFQAPSAGLENRQNSRVSENPPEIGSHKSLGSNPF